MAPKQLMTWSGTQRRWFKKYRSKVVSVSCRQLGVPPTKEASRQAANDWWKKRETELARKLEPPAPTHWAERRQEIADFLRSEGEIEAAKRIESKTESEIKNDFVDQLADKIVMHKLGIDAEPLRQSAVIQYRSKQAVPQERTIKAQITLLLAFIQSKAEHNAKSVGRWGAMKTHLSIFQDWFGANTAIDEISNATLRDYYMFVLQNQTWSRDYKHSVFGSARQFIRHLGEEELIPLPGKIDSKDFAFGRAKKTPKRFELDEIKAILDSATDRTKLYVLMMLNCGMYQSDISDLLVGEVDWKKGRIKRKRSKTDEFEDVPEVDYPLWSDTFRLLKKYGNHSGPGNVRALTTDEGRPLKQESIKDGKLSKTDNIQSAYVRLLRDKMKVPVSKRKPLKLARKTSAAILESNPSYGRYGDHFLGHVPRSMKEKHYTLSDARIFDQAIIWLGKQYGF